MYDDMIGNVDGRRFLENPKFHGELKKHKVQSPKIKNTIHEENFAYPERGS